MNAELLGAFDAGFGSEVGHGFESGNEFGAAVGITRIIDGVDAEKDVTGIGYFGIGESEGKEDGVACRHISDRDAGGGGRRLIILGDRDVGSKGGAAEEAKVDGGDLVLCRAETLSDFASRDEFDGMALAVIERETVAIEALAESQSESSGGIKAAAQKANRAGTGGVLQISV